MKEKILISACLIGDNTRYDGKSCKNDDVLKLTKYYDLIPICPEVNGGLKTPRDPSEIKGNKVISSKGKDVTSYYQDGAFLAESICHLFSIKLAILKENSPSCGVNFIHDGTFSGNLIKGKGITTERLEKLGVKCITENQINELIEYKDKTENEGTNEETKI